MPVIETPKEFLIERILKAGFRGIFVGGCIERKEGSSFRRKAHCHWIRNRDGSLATYGGWICVRSAKRLFKADGRPSRLLIHEVAHLLAPRQWHSKTYSKRRLELQAEIEGGA